jgi:poly-gamma-glutamate synthesis protein (capsule biosynthesis protein)
VAVVALLGDVMLGREVGEALARAGPKPLFAADLLAVLSEADAVVANLECCISTRGERWPEPGKPFFFRAPPAAVDALRLLGVTAVTLANNHALDYGYDALADTLALLHDAGIATTGAGANVAAARTPALVDVAGVPLSIVGCTDHPASYAATETRPGVALAEVGPTLDPWIVDAVRAGADRVVLVSPHWGPNMAAAPIRRVQHAAAALLRAGAALVAGHSAHVFHGVSGRVLYDLGDFVDDYATDPDLRNDLGLVFLVNITPHGPEHLDAIPIALDFCHTRLAAGDEAAWIADRFTAACAQMGTTVERRGNRLTVALRAGP